MLLYAGTRGEHGVSTTEPRLVAFVVPEPANTPRRHKASRNELRAELGERLPAYMVPSAFVLLDALPLTANRKLDRAALERLPVAIEPSAEAAFVAPRTPVETALAEIWSELLDVPRVGATDHFFALGGHSLLAVRVNARLLDTLGVELPLKAFFEEPVLAGLAATIERRTAAATDTEAAAIAPPPITPRPADAPPAPLSFGQERLWFLDQLEPGNAAYHVPIALRLRGRLDAPALAAALAGVVRRHEVLRSAIRTLAGEPVQIVSPEVDVPLPVVDLSRLPADRAPAAASALAAEEVRRPFDLGQPPLLRALLVRFAPDEHAAVATIHHVATDGWSTGIFVRELATLYRTARAARKGEDGDADLPGLPNLPGLPVLSIQYADVAAWQRSWLQGETLERMLGSWRERLAGAPDLELPTDRPRPPVRRGRGGQVPVALPAELTDALAERCRAEGATLFMGLLALVSTLLGRSGGQLDLTIGTPVANRRRTEVEPLIGFFVNTLALRTDLSGSPGFRELLARVRETTIEAYAHQEVPFERLVDDLGVERRLDRTPLYQALLALQSVPFGEVELPELTLEPWAATPGAAQTDLAFRLRERDGAIGLGGILEYDTDLFERQTMERLVEHLEILLRGALEHPDTPVARLPLMSEAETRQLLETWNATDRPYSPRPLHEAFDGQARRTPDAIAVVLDGEPGDSGPRCLSYAALAHRARRLAARLAAAGVRPGDRVGVLMERSPEMVTALLAVLGAGAAYVPLEPDLPAERLAFMLDDFAVGLEHPVVLTREPLDESGSAVREALLRGAGGDAAHRLRALSLDDSAFDGVGDTISDGEDEAPSPPAPALGLDAPAYAIYTSGSTGRPKGTVNSHRGIANRLLWMQETFAIGPGDRVLQKTPIGFDVSVWELFWPLTTGGTMVLARPGGHRDPRYLAEVVARNGVTVLHFVPSMLRAFVAEADLASLAGVCRIFSSGEALPADLASRVTGHLAPFGVELHNLYGPTEAAVDVTWWPCPPAPGARRIPIGKPVANTRVYVLDPDLEPVPVGAPGELHLAGVQLANGYLGRPGLTAERFIPNPFTGHGERLYRTGDRTRWTLDGEIEYFGRIDHQVKIRGQRIEPGEIEAVLGTHAAVSEVAVLPRRRQGETVLVAYLVPADGSGEVPVGALRDHLRGQLPEPMIPGVFHSLEEMPLTPNGKLDRKALGRLALPELTPTEEWVAPRTPVERELARIWSELLGLPEDRVGVHDHFFDLGGHSLMATRVAARIEESFSVRLPLRTLFQAPTVAGLAERIEAERPETTEAAAIAEALERIEELSEEEAAALLAELGVAGAEED